MGKIPNKRLIRLADIVEWYDVDEKAVLKAVDAGTIKGIKLYPGARNYYSKDQVRKVFEGE